jgi:hypothetical protein
MMTRTLCVDLSLALCGVGIRSEAALERFRATFLGATLIGVTFAWWDFPHYTLGSLVGRLWLRGISGITAYRI